MNSTILVVDDDPLNMEMISIILKQKSYNFLYASNGQEGIDIAKAQFPDAIIMDWEMPGINGLDAVKILKQDADTKDIPVIIATGKMTSPDDLAKALDAGAIDYVRKPIVATELNARLNSALELSKSYNLIKEQHRSVKYSLHYAREIQRAMLPPKAELTDHFSDNLVVEKPRELLSGDLYWVTHNKEDSKVFVFLCDPGPSITGALLSTMTNVLLHRILDEKGFVHPEVVLQELNKLLLAEFSDEEIRDREGIKISACLFDLKSKEMEFAGAKSSVLVFQDGEMTQLKGDRKFAGGYQKEADRSYETHKMSLKEGDSVYLISNGFGNQLGGHENKKYKSKKVREMIAAIHKMPFDQQKSHIEEEFDNWINAGNEIQHDDVTVIGIKI